MNILLEFRDFMFVENWCYFIIKCWDKEFCGWSICLKVIMFCVLKINYYRERWKIEKKLGNYYSNMIDGGVLFGVGVRVWF